MLSVALSVEPISAALCRPRISLSRGFQASNRHSEMAGTWRPLRGFVESVRRERPLPNGPKAEISFRSECDHILFAYLI